MINQNLFRLSVKPIFPKVVVENFNLVSIDTVCQYAYLEVDGFDNTLAVSYAFDSDKTPTGFWPQVWVFECVSGESDPAELILPEALVAAIITLHG